MKKQTEQADASGYEAGARVYGDILSATFTQYSAEWTRLGNMQSAAGALLTLDSVAMAIIVGARPSAQEWAALTYEVQYVVIMAFLMAVAGFVVAFWCVIPVLWNAPALSLSLPSELRRKIDQHLEEFVSSTEAAPNHVFSQSYLMGRFENELRLVKQDIAKKSAWFHCCLVATVFSIAMSIFILIVYYIGV